MGSDIGPSEGIRPPAPTVPPHRRVPKPTPERDKEKQRHPPESPKPDDDEDHHIIDEYV